MISYSTSTRRYPRLAQPRAPWWRRLLGKEEKVSQVESYRASEPVPDPTSPFDHSPGCRFQDAELAWIREERGHWIRTCGCGSAHWRAPLSTKTTPPAAARVFPHGVDEDGTPCAAAAKLVYDEGDQLWRETCRNCGTTLTHLPDAWSDRSPVWADRDIYAAPRR